MELSSFWYEITGLFILIVCAGIFSAAETAFTAASRARLLTLENEGNARAKLINKLRQQQDKVIGAVLFGNNLANILASALATSALIKIFGEAGIVYATLGVTFLVLVFAEVLPKTYALANAEKCSLIIAPVLVVLVAIFSPITYGVAKIVEFIFKLFGVETKVLDDDEHEDELRGAIQIFKDALDLEEEQEKGSMLRSILDLADVEVEEIMIHRKNVKMICGDVSMNQIIDAVMNSSCTRMPVWKDDPDNIIGVIHTKLLLKEILSCKGKVDKVDLTKAMIKPWFIPESTTLFDQLQAFRKRREHFAIMVDEYGALMGVVTLEDILEEIVGDINDESDTEESAGIREQSDGSYLVNGEVTIRDLNRELDWNLPDEEYSTVAGLVLFESQRIPEEGQIFNLFDFRFEVLRKDKNQITLLNIAKLLEDGED